MLLKPFLNNVSGVAGGIILSKEATAIREYCCVGYATRLVLSNTVHVGVKPTCYVLRSTVYKQNIVQNFTWLPLACLLPVVLLSSLVQITEADTPSRPRIQRSCDLSDLPSTDFPASRTSTSITDRPRTA